MDIGTIFLLMIAVVVAVWVISVLARKHVYAVTSLSPEDAATVLDSKFSSLAWKRVDGRGAVNYQARGLSIGGRTPPVVSIHLSTDDDTGLTCVEFWMSEWTSQWGMVSHVEKVFWKRWSIPKALRDAEQARRPIDSSASRPPNVGPLAAPLSAGVVQPASKSAEQRKPAAPDAKVNLPNPGRPQGDLQQLGYEMFDACGLTYLMWGPIRIEQLVSKVLECIPSLRDATVSGGCGRQGSEVSPEGVWMAYDGPRGSLLAFHVFRDSDFSIEEVGFKLKLLPDPVLWDIATVGAKVPAGVAEILNDARAVPLWELSTFSAQRFNVEDLKVPANLGSELRALGWTHIDNGGNGYKLDVPLNRGGIQAVFFTPYDAQSFALVAPLDKAVKGRVPDELRGRVFRHYSLEVIGDMTVLSEKFPAGPPIPDANDITVAGRELTLYVESQIMSPQPLAAQAVQEPQISSFVGGTADSAKPANAPSRGVFYREVDVPDPGEILVRVIGEIAGESSATSAEAEVNSLRRRDGNIVAADVSGLNVEKHSPITSLNGLLAFEEISLMAWAEGGFGPLQKPTASREIKERWRNHGLSAAVNWVLANAKHRPDVEGLKDLLERNAANPEGHLEAAFRTNLADKLRRTAKNGQSPGLGAATPRLESEEEIRFAPMLSDTSSTTGSAAFLDSPNGQRPIQRTPSLPKRWIVAAGAGIFLAIVAWLFGNSKSTPNANIAARDNTPAEVEGQRSQSPQSETTASLPSAAKVDSEASSLAQLRAIADGDRSFVARQLADLWVPQISSKRPGIVDDGLVWDNAQTLKELLDNRERYGAKLLRSGDWSTFSAPDFWVTVVPVTFDDSEGALDWCTSHGFDSWHCIAKFVSSTHPVAGSTAVNGG